MDEVAVLVEAGWTVAEAEVALASLHAQMGLAGRTIMDYRNMTGTALVAHFGEDAGRAAVVLLAYLQREQYLR